MTEHGHCESKHHENGEKNRLGRGPQGKPEKLEQGVEREGAEHDVDRFPADNREPGEQ